MLFTFLLKFLQLFFIFLLNKITNFAINKNEAIIFKISMCKNLFNNKILPLKKVLVKHIRQQKPKRDTY